MVFATGQNAAKQVHSANGESFNSIGAHRSSIRPFLKAVQGVSMPARAKQRPVALL